VVHARGPQIMTGYYKRPDLTEQIISSNGWLDTGDLGMLTWDNELKITGRAKDTVVLLGGENIEPAPIEERLRASEFIAQAVVLGQDQKFLGALIVPDFEALDAWTETERVTAASREELVEDPKVRSMYNQVISGIVNAQNGFKSFEQIYRFQILPTDFTVGEELSAKQEIKRHVIDARYKTQIAQLFT
jgi:long-chain acyl-CoA synthetase